MKRHGLQRAGVPSGEAASTDHTTVAYVAPGGSADFALPVPLAAGAADELIVWRNGLLVLPVDPPTTADEYKVVDGDTIRLGAAPAAGEIITVRLPLEGGPSYTLAAFTAPGGSADFTLNPEIVADGEDRVSVWRNGLALVPAATPATVDEYVVPDLATLRLGAAPEAGEIIAVRYPTD